MELTGSEHAAIRIAAAAELAAQPDASWQSLVRSLATDPDPMVRLEAARLIAPYDQQLANSTLDGLMRDGNIAIRESASGVFVDRVADALSVLGSKKLRPMTFTDIGVESILLALRTELSDRCPSGHLYGESLATALATRLVWLRERPGNDNQAGGLPSARLRQVLDYIEANLAGDTSIHRLAELARVGPRQFERLFVQSVGVPPHQCILRRRIAGSKDLLLNSQLSLAEISGRLGFRSQSHFATTFRNKVGLTPGAFRKRRSSN